jgi:hypothetical protein
MKTFFKNYLIKLKECAFSASPIILLIVILQAVLGEWMSAEKQINFAVSIVLLILGMALFLTGVNTGILTMGELVGGNIRKLKTLPVILLFGFIFGTVATMAEPAVGVLSGQISSVSGIGNFLLMMSASVSTGIFVAYALLRIFLSFSIKISFLMIYAIAFVLVFLSPQPFHALAFDVSGATTGSITVPFILALGAGVNAVLGRKSKDDSYGLIGLCSIGPVITIAILGLIFGSGTANAAVTDSNLPLILQSFINILSALAPVAIIFFLFNLFFIHLPRSKIKQILVGLSLTVIGLTLFITGVNLGFTDAGRFIGEAITDPARDDWLKYMLIPLGFALGFAMAYAEPAIKVLADQIENNTQGKIKKTVLMLTLALSIALTIMFAMIRILFEIPILWFLVPMFAVGFILMPFVPKLFVGVAFDSGGVASGTITATFAVPFALGACMMLGIDSLTFGFGILAFICVIPIPTICLLGFIYNLKIQKSKKFTPKHIGNVLLKTAKQLQIFCIICKNSLEQNIVEMLSELNAHTATTLNAKGSSRTPTAAFDINPEEKICIIGTIERQDAAAMIDGLERHFNFLDPHSGIAWTIPIESTLFSALSASSKINIEGVK